MRKLKDQTIKILLKKEKYNKPKIIINKVYTKSGDKGNTSIVGGHKLSKDSLRIESFGLIEELNTFVGSCILLLDHMKKKDSSIVYAYLFRLQNELFNLGNMLSTLDSDYSLSMPQVNKEDLEYMETLIDNINKTLPVLDSFILPGGSDLSVRFHQARTMCRRCERIVVSLNKKEKINKIILPYINRLSDLFFVLSRWANTILQVEEITWNPNYNK